MKKTHWTTLWGSVGMLAAFVLWTICLCLVDVQTLGPQNSAVGLASINRLFHELTDVHMSLYVLTDWLSLIPGGIALGFALLGLCQWIKRKRLRAVDPSLFVLGGFYFVTAAVYVLFEVLVINYRPILIHGRLEASYPSSTTMLVLCVMPTALMQARTRIKNCFFKRCVTFAAIAFLVFMVVGRLVSGVHWFTDIVGGILLSTGLVLLYHFVCQTIRPQ